jgi:hypothetical protein
MTRASISEVNSLSSTSELCILRDGRILVHNLTPAVAALLAKLDPGDEAMRIRADSCDSSNNEKAAPE